MGIPLAMHTIAGTRLILGPSRALHGKEFRDTFGTDAELLKHTNGLVEEFEGKILGGGNNANK